MKQLAAFLLSAILLASCGSEEKAPREVPDGVLSKDSMAYYLSEVHVIDAALRHRKVRKGNMQPYAKRAFIEYFDTAQISRDRFVESLEFWAEDFEELSEIYDMSMERISTQIVQLKREEKESKKSTE